MSAKRTTTQTFLLVLLAAVLGLATGLPAQAQTAEQLITLTELAHELSFDIAQSREVLRGRCIESEWCGVYAEELDKALDGADTTLRLGPIALPQIEEMLEIMDAPDRVALFEFYLSPVGKRVVELERASREAPFLEQIAREGETIYQRQSDERIALIEAVDSNSDASATQRSHDKIMVRVVEWLDEKARVSKGEPVAPVDSGLAERHRHPYHQRLSLTYESLSDEELELFVEFLASEAGEYWMSTKRDIRRDAIRATATPILGSLMTRLGN
ncbi:MAG: hypothetical protein AAGD38_05475 [Acidobacteriota bacterium]